MTLIYHFTLNYRMLNLSYLQFYYVQNIKLTETGQLLK